MTNKKRCDILITVVRKWLKHVPCGGIAQLARALGSYPNGRWFKSDFRYHNGPLVKRLRHGPFTAVTWVRFPYGSPDKKHCKSSAFLFLFLPIAPTALSHPGRIVVLRARTRLASKLLALRGIAARKQPL